MSQTSGSSTMSPRPYDWLTRASGVSDAHWQLVAQAAIWPRSVVLEIGSGTGNVLLKVKRAHPESMACGLDSDAASLAEATRKAARVGVKLQLEQGDAAHLPYTDAYFDRVLVSFVLHHLPEDQKGLMLQEVARVLKSDGSAHFLEFKAGIRRPFVFASRFPRSHGHGRHEEEQGAMDPRALMAQAGLIDPVLVGEGRSRLGRHTFYRASK